MNNKTNNKPNSPDPLDSKILTTSMISTKPLNIIDNIKLVIRPLKKKKKEKK